MIVANWNGFEELQRWAATTNDSWVLVEDAGPDAVAVGPQFTPSGGICFDCYIARRSGNGADECRPPRASSRPIVERFGASLSTGGARFSPWLQKIFTMSGEKSRHYVLPIPGCPKCAKADLEIPPGLASLVSSRVGLVHRVETIQDVWCDYSMCRAIGSRTDAFISVRAINHGMATDTSNGAAWIRAVGEAIERYCAAFVPSDIHPPVCSDEIQGRVLLPSEFGTARADDTSMFRWVDVRSIRTDEMAWAPAGHVYIPYLTSEREDNTGIMDSTGLGAGATLENALEHALMEVIERDAFMRAWRNNTIIYRVPSTAMLPGLHLAEVPCAFQVRVVIAFLEADEPPFTAVGLAARRSLADAVTSATHEAVAAKAWLQAWLASHPSKPSYPPRTLEDHARVHAVYPELQATRRRWLDPQEPAPSCVDGVSWRELVNAMPECYYKDVTTPDVLAAGAYVARVLAPNFVRLDRDALNPTLNGNLVPHPLA